MTATAIFGGGCFWCTEAVFKMLKGVTSVTPGYAAGHTENPKYLQVCTGETGHAEVIKIEYDPTLVSFHTLLTVFFASHDPTTLNRQGNDIGTQYRSIIVAETEEQEKEAKQFVTDLNNSNPNGSQITTEVVPKTTFYEAEQSHKDYYERNKTQGYCQVVINPKLEKVQKEFAALLKANG